MKQKIDPNMNTIIFIGGMIDIALLFISVGMWLWSIFGYSILSAEERRASAELSSAAGTLFWIFVAYTFFFGIFVNVVMPIDNHNNRRVNRKRNNNRNTHYRQKPFCEECGCPDVIVFVDGTCECQGCGYTWRE